VFSFWACSDVIREVVQDFQTLVDGNRASWTAWVTDNQWTPYMFSDTAMTQLTHFGKLVQTWLAAKGNSDWVGP
jgi:hypothetical protein